MRVIEPWYTVTELEPPAGRLAIESQVPFAKPAEDRNGNPIVEKLATIGERILRVHDLELYLHLEKLEVAPHLYGIRWMRLLFGREFPLQDLLVVWDAVFADGYDAGFGLVDYIFVAMLINIRSLLLASDFSGAMTYLMRYPQGSDVNFIVSLAYHLRAPDAYPKPSLTGFQGLYMQKRRRHAGGGGGRSAHRSSGNRYHTVGIDTSSLRAAIQRIGSQESLQQQQQQQKQQPQDTIETSASASALLRIGSFVSSKSHSVAEQAQQQKQQSQPSNHRPSSLIFGFSREDSQQNLLHHQQQQQ
ncbi:hypothetical protein BOX15_Mlig005158g1 [Macrostomum lignano]|uniref:Rab-GAP TBC domain-containing protein n=1 Tax=Macrostomum lignano TaxID=282301 RepID=A0A267F3J1_9PLAT|nr:hypothetical protein BOX15_Mlig005158g1 [Macrostomum lignano]